MSRVAAEMAILDDSTSHDERDAGSCSSLRTGGHEVATRAGDEQRAASPLGNLLWERTSRCGHIKKSRKHTCIHDIASGKSVWSYLIRLEVPVGTYLVKAHDRCLLSSV